MKNYVLKKWYKGKDHRKFAYPKDVDAELVPMLDVFNNIPGVRTIYSCSGHGYPGWYLDIRTTSNFMFSILCTYFTKKGDGFGLFTDVDFKVQTADASLLNMVPEKRITVYCDELGMMKSEDRRRQYMKICEFFSRFSPDSDWKTVHEF